MPKVYTVNRNADMTEGRGPMTLDRVFSDLEKAKEYVDKQSGVMGRRFGGNFEHTPSKNYPSSKMKGYSMVDGKLQDFIVFPEWSTRPQWSKNDHDIVEVEVDEVNVNRR